MVTIVTSQRAARPAEYHNMIVWWLKHHVEQRRSLTGETVKDPDPTLSLWSQSCSWKSSSQSAPFLCRSGATLSDWRTSLQMRCRVLVAFWRLLMDGWWSIKVKSRIRWMYLANSTGNILLYIINIGPYLEFHFKYVYDVEHESSRTW